MHKTTALRLLLRLSVFVIALHAVCGPVAAYVPPESTVDLIDYPLYAPDSGITEPKVLVEGRPKISLPLPHKAVGPPVMVFELFIDQTGRVRRVYVHRGRSWRLTPEYVASMSRWVFQPATKNGRAIPVRYVITVRP
jgi:hypothetical protein